MKYSLVRAFLTEKNGFGAIQEFFGGADSNALFYFEMAVVPKKLLQSLCCVCGPFRSGSFDKSLFKIFRKCR